MGRGAGGYVCGDGGGAKYFFSRPKTPLSQESPPNSPRFPETPDVSVDFGVLTITEHVKRDI